MTRTYLDHNATSPLRPVARAAALAALDACGNASSVHAEGRAARARIEDARETVAALVGGVAKNVVFTSGATEALALALRPVWRASEKGGPAEILLLSATEHVAALEGHGFGRRAEILPVDRSGQLDLFALEAALAGYAGARVALCLQAANNETGVLQAVAEAAARVHAHGGLVICDAVQAAGRIPCTFEATGADMLILSSHKIGGPQGAGALISREALHCDQPLIRGGGQERGFRAGTENVAAISGFGAAAGEAAADMPAEAGRLRGLREKLEAEILRLAPEAKIFGADAPRLPNTSAFALPGVTAEIALMSLDLTGFALSSGSACSSGKVRRSHVLAAMGVAPAEAAGALRASFGWSSGAADVAAFSVALGDILARLGRKRATT